MDYGSSEILWHRSCPDREIGYCLIYCTSETYILKLSDDYAVNYRLVFDISETIIGSRFR